MADGAGLQFDAPVPDAQAAPTFDHVTDYVFIVVIDLLDV
jgi:hypothetical protein